MGSAKSGLKLATGYVVVCNSLLSEAAPECCEVLLEVRTLAGRPVTEFLDTLES